MAYLHIQTLVVSQWQEFTRSIAKSISKNFHLIYQFHLGQPDHGGGSTTEVTAGYDGSSDDETATGITLGLRDTNGAVLARTEDHNKQHNISGEYRELCEEGSAGCGGVTHIPEFSQANKGAYGKQFNIIWVGMQQPGGVNYKGYVQVGNNTYLIANLTNPKTGGRGGGGHGGPDGGSVINYLTQHNYFARGRTNNSGDNATISGILYADGDDTYHPPANTKMSDSGFYNEYPGYYYWS